MSIQVVHHDVVSVTNRRRSALNPVPPKTGSVPEIPNDSNINLAAVMHHAWLMACLLIGITKCRILKTRTRIILQNTQLPDLK